MNKKKSAVIPAEAGIHFASYVSNNINMDSRFRGNDVLRLGSLNP
jgi:hypothetical protein